eukprot:4062635-Amphidinium_carterae.2
MVLICSSAPPTHTPKFKLHRTGGSGAVMFDGFCTRFSKCSEFLQWKGQNTLTQHLERPVHGRDTRSSMRKCSSPLPPLELGLPVQAMLCSRALDNPQVFLAVPISMHGQAKIHAMSCSCRKHVPTLLCFSIVRVCASSKASDEANADVCCHCEQRP